MTRYFAADPTELGLSVSALVFRGGELLLMRRSDNGYWSLRGGFVEIGESVSDAARREVFWLNEHEVNYYVLEERELTAIPLLLPNLLDDLDAK